MKQDDIDHIRYAVWDVGAISVAAAADVPRPGSQAKSHDLSEENGI